MYCEHIPFYINEINHFMFYNFTSLNKKVA